MQKHSVSIRATKWQLKFWHRYRHVRIRFLWRQLHVSIARKRGAPPFKFLYENECQLYDLIGGQNVYIYIYIYIYSHAFRPSQYSAVWLGLTSREQLMSPECSKHQVLSFAKMLAVWWTNKKYCFHQCSPECSMNKFRAYLSTDTCFVLPRTHQCGSG